ncbi:PEP-CTERM family integral membrane protein [Cylindrospermum stagnale PCC 7417]|uniref:PEP-CTERM family integral membrane protein n=1 Tax=Cylindrospermum stagnale PCC 7417 TaxID=56107 RepID=K9WU51_9NOST|nr:TIGR02921 family PEP-CTERM protein [Cylindrospermum stagnale]AFZ23910.1 PEP-CTERM family integral membrane protein [Cylindrospermum stagnale PCC 7417]
MKAFPNILFYAIFGIWNVVFLLVAYTGLLPIIGVPLVRATLAGDIPIEFSLTLAALVAVPTICTLVGCLNFAKKPRQLIRLFYGVEAPLLLICLLRLFVIRELTPASTQIIATLGLCIGAFFLELIHGYADRQKATAWLQMLIHSLMLLIGLYVGAVLLFYAVPLAAVIVQEFFKFQWATILLQALTINLFWLFPGLILWGLSTTLFVFMPLAFVGLYVDSARRILVRFASQYGHKRSLTGSFAIAFAWIIIFISLQQQPQVQAFSLLKNPATTDSSRQALLAKSNVIREGLVNAYLSDYRYLSSIKENDHIHAMYRSVFNSPEWLCQFLQAQYNQLMSPWLYNGSSEDSEKAQKLYAEFFDTPLQKAERSAVSHAVQSTFNQQEVKAGLLNINEKKVWLRSQQVTVAEHGDWADVELYEVYKNETPEVQEIFYSFSLPESAVISGLWLGDTSDVSKRFPFVVAPRGAAQKVYNSQVRRTRPVDPALLEQVGPRHYRLRAFPIPPKSLPSFDNAAPQRPTEMHLWLTYKVMRQDKGWAMPNLGEKRNIFWTKYSQRLRQGKVVSPAGDAWLEPYLAASTQAEPRLHQVNFSDRYSITAKPLAKSDYSLPKGQRFAIVIDSSRSMGNHLKELSSTLAWVQKPDFANNNHADVYITTAKGVAPQRLDDIRQFKAEKITFYGTIQPVEMVQQFNQLRGDTSYDGVLLVTDQGSYELTAENKVKKQGGTYPAISAPLWMVHLGDLPAAYDDATIKAMQDSGGGISQQLPEVLQRIATKAALGESAVNVVDGYAWYQVASPGSPTQNDDFQQLAARQLILGLSKQINLNQLANLDAIHDIAKKSEIVTPYSSMIVLVNDEQRAALKRAEAESDRFNRKVENGKEELSKPNNPLKVSVPESSNGWVIGITAIALLLFTRRQRRTLTPEGMINQPKD